MARPGNVPPVSNTSFEMRIDILTLFPGMFAGPFAESIVARAVERGLVDIALHNIRDFAHDRHGTVDDYPYGGGPGMVMMPGPIFEAVEAVRANFGDKRPAILLTPQGRLFTQRIADALAHLNGIILICGHYEGVDERVRQSLVDDELSIGDYVLTGGELAAMVVTDAVVRRIPGVLGDEASAEDDSHVSGLLQYPQYTRPATFRGWPVPPVLLSGNHAEVARWRRRQAMIRTWQRRPDLLKGAQLSAEDRKLLEMAIAEQAR